MYAVTVSLYDISSLDYTGFRIKSYAFEHLEW
jgi:hypothetical protein